MRHSIGIRFAKGHAFLSFAKSMSKNIDKK